MEKFKSRKRSFDKPNKEGESEEGKKKFVYKGPPVLGHAPRPGICRKCDSVWRSMIRWRNTNRYRKDIPVPLSGSGEDADKRTVVSTKKFGDIIVPSVNQIWKEMMPGPRPKKRLKNVRMPEPKVTGKRR